MRKFFLALALALIFIPSFIPRLRSWEWPDFVEVDQDGHILVGSTYGTRGPCLRMFDSDGRVLWVRKMRVSAYTGPDGQLQLVEHHKGHLDVVRYGGNGERTLIRRLRLPEGIDDGHLVQAGPEHYVVSSWVESESRAYRTNFLLRYNIRGRLVDSYEYRSESFKEMSDNYYVSNDSVWDSLGSHYEIGHRTSERHNTAIVLFTKHDPQGNLVFCREIETKGNYAVLWEIQVDRNDNVYFAGDVKGHSVLYGNYESQTGILQVKEIESGLAEGRYIDVYAIRRTRQGGFYIAGDSHDYSSAGHKAFITSVSPDGDHRLLWQAPDARNTLCQFRRMGIDNNDNLFVVNELKGQRQWSTLTKLDASGRLIWTRHYNSLGFILFKSSILAGIGLLIVLIIQKPISFLIKRLGHRKPESGA